MKNLKKDIKENGLNIDAGLFGSESLDSTFCETSCACCCTNGCLWSGASGSNDEEEEEEDEG